MEERDNVIIRNMGVKKVLMENGDAITISKLSGCCCPQLLSDKLDHSRNVWVDHCDFSSDLDHGKDYYDGLVDVSALSPWK